MEHKILGVFILTMALTTSGCGETTGTEAGSSTLGNDSYSDIDASYTTPLSDLDTYTSDNPDSEYSSESDTDAHVYYGSGSQQVDPGGFSNNTSADLSSEPEFTKGNTAIDDEIRTIQNDSSDLAYQDRHQEGFQNLERRDAEHYLWSKQDVDGNSYQYVPSMIRTAGYSAIKTGQYWRTKSVSAENVATHAEKKMKLCFFALRRCFSREPAQILCWQTS